MAYVTIGVLLAVIVMLMIALTQLLAERRRLSRELSRLSGTTADLDRAITSANKEQ